MARGDSPGLRIVAWRWESEVFQLPEAMREGIQAAVSGAVLQLRKTIDVAGLRLLTPATGEHFVRVVNGDEDNRLQFQIAPQRIVYHHARNDPPGLEIGDVRDRLAAHLRHVATPLLAAAKTNFKDRIQMVALGYEVLCEFKRREGRRPNIESLTTHVANRLTPLLTAVLDKTNPQVGRLDLKIGVDHEIGDEPTEIWFDLQCPGNADYTRIEATVSVQSRSGKPSTNEWAMAPTTVHDDVWPTVQRFFDRLGG